MTTDIEYYGQCEHIFCTDIEHKDCLKRYFLVNDYNRMKQYKLAVCNDYLRLKLHERRVKGSWGYRNEATDVIYDIISKHTGVEKIKGDWSDKFSMGLVVCDRPSIYKRVNFFEALKMLSEGITVNEWRLNYIVKDSIVNAFADVKNYMNRYAKYKASTDKLNRIERKLKGFMSLTDIEKADLLACIMDLMIKYKINKL